MGHGTPDFGATSGVQTTYQLMDLGELAARLGSPVTYDRLGDVIAVLDFEDMVDRFTSFSGGVGAAVYRSWLRARRGSLSCKVVAGSAGDPSAGIRNIVYYKPTERLGFEVSFSFGSPFVGFVVTLTLITLTDAWQFAAEWRAGTSCMYVMDPSGGMVEVGVVPYSDPSNAGFHTLKLVADGSSGKYRRLLVDSNAYDVAAIGGFPYFGAGIPWLEWEVQLYSRPGHNDFCYLDDIIITQNEP